MPAWIVYGDAFGIVSRLAADGEPMRVEWLSGSAENVPPVATLLIPIAPVIADEPFVEKKKRGPATEAILTALRDHRGLFWRVGFVRSEEHTSELQSLMRISYAVFCLKKKKI